MKTLALVVHILLPVFVRSLSRATRMCGGGGWGAGAKEGEVNLKGVQAPN